ncbi:MAG: hypothetical protein J5637_07170 [Prevotella sp.]|nr:hypothetical protein [Prevotella sp.]
MERFTKNEALLEEAQRYWENAADFRRRRERCKRYCYGDQWGDLVMMEGQWVREEQYIRSMGSEPLKNNLIRRLVKQVLGLYRQQHDAATEGAVERLSGEDAVLREALGRMRRLNDMCELNARALEEFLISGMTVQRKTFGERQGRRECFTDNVSPARFIIDTAYRDTRGWDVGLVGEIHDLAFDTLCAEFATDAADCARLADIYAPETYAERLTRTTDYFAAARSMAKAFRTPANPAACRVYELWRRERRPGYLCHDTATGQLFLTDVAAVADVEAVNQWRHDMAAAAGRPADAVALIHTQWMMTDEWRYYYLTPFGDVLSEGRSPYAHRKHPYVFKAYPYVDGEIHSFVADIIDQQRYTNRLITLYDWVMRSSAKGVLLVPEESIPDGYTIDDIASQWALFNGVIPVKTRNGALLPQQVAANAVNVGISELLNTQLAFMEDISGVNGALQGKAEGASVSGKLFEQQTHNASVSQLDLLDSFRSFLDEAERKDVSNLKQFVVGDTETAGIA